MRGKWKVALCGVALAGSAMLLPSALPRSGLFLSAWSVPVAQAQWPGWLQRVAKTAEAREVALQGHSEAVFVSLSALGYRVDQGQTWERLVASPCAPFATTLHTIREAWARWSGCPDVALVWAFDADAARETLHETAAAFHVPAVDASLNFALHRRVADQPGYALNVNETLSRIAAIDPHDEAHVHVQLDEVEPSVRLSDLPPVDPSKVLSTYETDFRTKRGPRVHNIRQAARYLDGSLIPPGATLSFNRSVGARTAARGFIDAPVIVNDEMESGMGGGVCQVATTLHGAAIYGALEVVERRSHSRPSGYAPLGLDATVIDGVQDLKVRNPYDVPLYVRAYLPSRHVLRVEILGTELSGQVSHKYWVVQRHGYSRRVVEKADLTAGTVKRSQKGGYGYDTVSKVIFTHDDGSRRERRYRSTYYPVPEVLWVAPGTPLTELPPHPEGLRVADQSASL